MKKISKIEYQKNNKDRVSIYIDEEFAFGVHINTMIKYSLKKNMELDDDFINEILLQEDFVRAFNYAISLLARSSKSEKEVRLKLADKGYDILIIDRVINKLKDYKYIDDEEFSTRFINYKSSKYGKHKLREALYIKGVSKEIIEEKLKLIDSEDEVRTAQVMAEKKLKNLKETEPMKKRVKLSNFLMGKGFEYETVNKVVSELLSLEYE